MANIDLQSLISQLSVSTGGQSGAKTPGQTSAAGQLFGAILGQQQTLQVGDVASGKTLPGGNGLPVVDGDALPGMTPEMVKVAQALVQLAENPQAAGSLPVKELQSQIQQLLQAEDGMASETSLDDLSVLTNLVMAADTAPATAVTTPQNMPTNASDDASVDASVKVKLNDEQLLQAASTMGVDPAVAATVLQATQAIQSAQPVAAPSVAASSGRPPLTAAQVLSATNAATETPQPTQSTVSQPVAQLTVQSTVPSTLQSTVQSTIQPVAQAVVQNPLNAQSATTANQPAASQVTAQAQTSTQEITDDVVIKVRQAAQQATQQGQTAQVAGSVSAQEFFQQRVGRNTAVTNATANNNLAQDVEPGLIRLTDNLISKLDQVTNPTQNVANEQPLANTGQLTGANFKTMAQFNQTNSFASTSAAPTTAEVPVAEGGSRLQTLLQGDTAAQQAARNMQNQLGQQLQRMVRDGQWQANINLNPARLGQIRINMTMEDGVLTTQLLSANQGVRELLEGGMPRLRELLEESGLQLGQFDVGSDAGNQQQFAQQEENNGVVTQVSSTDDANTAAATVSQSQHDGDLDTFA